MSQAITVLCIAAGGVAAPWLAGRLRIVPIVLLAFGLLGCAPTAPTATEQP